MSCFRFLGFYWASKFFKWDTYLFFILKNRIKSDLRVENVLSFQRICLSFHFDKYSARYMQNRKLSMASFLMTDIANQSYRHISLILLKVGILFLIFCFSPGNLVSHSFLLPNISVRPSSSISLPVYRLGWTILYTRWRSSVVFYLFAAVRLIIDGNRYRSRSNIL